VNPAALPTSVSQRWRVDVVPDTASTNADLLLAAVAGAPEGTVLAAEYQHGGRGRLDRSWSSPSGAGLTFSMLLRPRVPLMRWGWLPLLAGVALSSAVGADARLKWPNDLLLGPDGRKAAGILVQIGDDAAVIGVGLNVSTTAEELPVDTATSLALEGASELDRTALLGAFLERFSPLYDGWQAALGDAETSGLAAAFRAACATLGAAVSIELADERLEGEAVDVDPDGRLLVRPDEGGDPRAVAAGDVTHLRTVSR
jgi:BirA family biotin operon repressor/biotin-[acetyl-CoA-carboxylase] ligase